MIPKTKVFLCDDHAIVREGLKALLDSQPDMEVVGEATDGESAKLRLRDCPADVAVVDLSMPGMSGAELTAWIGRERPKLRVVALTVHEDRGYLMQVLQAGGAGYVLKRAAADELVRAVRSVSAGIPYVDPALTKHLVNAVSRQSQSSGTTGAGGALQPGLSNRELEIAKHIALGYSNKEMAALFELSVKTVETHKARLMEKLGFHSRVQLVRFAIEQGWLASD